MKHFIIAILFLVFTACSNQEATPVVEAEETVVPKDPDATATDNTGELQGEWRSVDDEVSGLRFEGNLMIMSYDGSDEETGENFVIGPECPGSPPSTTKDPTGRYLSVPDTDRCYFIVKLTDTELVLSYVGRGNTLRYIRAD